MVLCDVSIRYTEGQLRADMAYNYITPYTNPQSVVWDEDTENFMDEWCAASRRFCL